MTPYRGGPPATRTRHAFGNETVRLFLGVAGVAALVGGAVVGVLAVAKTGHIEFALLAPLLGLGSAGVVVIRHFLSSTRRRPIRSTCSC